MKKIKTWMPILAIASASVALAPALALTSCGEKVKTAEVKSVSELQTALKDETIGAIKVCDYIEFENETDPFVIEINRSLKIYCGKGDYSEIWRTINGQNMSNGGLIRITNPNPEQQMKVTIQNIGLRLKSTAWSSIISLNNAENVTLNVDGVIASSDLQEGQNYIRGDVLTIEENTASAPCTINISNHSSFNGWAAIYNKGSNVKLNAQNSEFIGWNDYNPKGDNVFATIVMAAHPMFYHTMNRSFSANNDFTFKNCELSASTSWPKTEDYKHEYQFVFECRSPANNKLHIDENTLSNIDYYEAEMKNLFVTASENNGSVTDTNIQNYINGLGKENADIPDEIKSKDDYYRHYKDETLSQMYIGKVPFDEYTGKYKDYFKRTTLDENFHYLNIEE